MTHNAALRGAVAGLVGVAAMTLAEKLEQAQTGRPNSYVPGRTLLTLVGHRPAEGTKPLLANHAMHWMTGVALGALRGVWAELGLRGPRASLAHTVVRLSTDQTLENASGEGAPPHTWPKQEQVVDTLHKAVYSFVTGAVADAIISPKRMSTTGARSH
jgi:hypothetical protein